MIKGMPYFLRMVLDSNFVIPGPDFPKFWAKVLDHFLLFKSSNIYLGEERLNEKVSLQLKWIKGREKKKRRGRGTDGMFAERKKGEKMNVVEELFSQWGNVKRDQKVILSLLLLPVVVELSVLECRYSPIKAWNKWHQTLSLLTYYINKTLIFDISIHLLTSVCGWEMKSFCILRLEVDFLSCYVYVFGC